MVWVIDLRRGSEDLTVNAENVTQDTVALGYSFMDTFIQSYT